MKAKRLVFLALCAVIMLTSSVFPTALNIKAAEPARDYSAYDYSNPESTFNTTASAQDVLEGLGYTISDAERAYLDAYCEFKLHYDLVLSDKISYSKDTSIGNEDETIKITATPYTYTAKNGEEVTWNPISADILDGDGTVIDSFTFDDGTVYVAEFENIVIADDYTYRVQYSANFGIDSEDADSILNFAFNAAKEAVGPIEFYRNNEQAVLAYYEYLGKQQEWEQNKANYEAYLDAKDKYEQDVIKYEQYLLDLAEYRKIEESINKYNANLERYNTYLSKLAEAEKQVKTLDAALFTKVTYLDRELYACLFSPLVDEVVARKDELVAAKPKLESHINNAKKASDNIQRIFRPADGVHYDKIEDVAQKYDFYVLHHKDICDNILLLANSLYKIYTTSGIRVAIHAACATLKRPDYTEKLVIFISQLFYFHDALVDTSSPIKYEDGKNDSYTTAQMRFDYRNQAGTDLKDKSIAEIFENEEYVTDTNSATPFVLVKVDEPVAPEITELPNKPDEVKEPVEPSVVHDPGAAPQPIVDKPAGLPEFNWQEFIYDESYRNLVLDIYNEFKDVANPRDVSFTEYTATTSIERPFKTVNVNITFNDESGSVIMTKEVEKGSFVIFDRPEPTKMSDAAATYRFDGWMTEDGKAYSLHSVTENVTLYPKFTTLYREYTVVGGNIGVDATDANISKLPIAYFAGLMNKNNASGINVAGADATLTLTNAKINALQIAGVSYLDVDVAALSSGKYSCNISAYDASDVKVDTSTSVDVYIPCMDLDMKVICTDAVGTEIKMHKNGAGKNYFSLNVGEVYSILAGYNVRESYGPLTAPKFAIPGETVELTVTVPAGMRAELSYEFNGNSYPIEGNSFVMPAGDIDLRLNFFDIIYTVKFESDGKIISEKEYIYGETLVLPNPPTKINDDKYSYKFIGWSPTISDTVTGSVTYVAKFKSTPLPVEEEKINWLRVAVVVAIVIFSIGMALLVLFILDKTKVISIKGIFAFIFKRKSKLDSVSDPESISDGEKEDSSKLNTPTEVAESGETSPNDPTEEINGDTRVEK